MLVSALTVGLAGFLQCWVPRTGIGQPQPAGFEPERSLSTVFGTQKMQVHSCSQIGRFAAFGDLDFSVNEEKTTMLQYHVYVCSFAARYWAWRLDA